MAAERVAHTQFGVLRFHDLKLTVALVPIYIICYIVTDCVIIEKDDSSNIWSHIGKRLNKLKNGVLIHNYKV